MCAVLCGISIHAPRTGSDRNSTYTLPVTSYISIHAPRTGSDNITLLHNARQCDFNPRSPHGERQHAGMLHVIGWTFQSTLPARGATFKQLIHDVSVEFQSTLPARGATGDRGGRRPRGVGISIHAPRTGSDAFDRMIEQRNAISIHAPRTGSDRKCALLLSYFPNISIHAPRTGSDEHDFERGWLLVISIHAPRTGSDATAMPFSDSSHTNFNPRSPHGERLRRRPAPCRRWNFNPRSPHGERHFANIERKIDNVFQSTLPARGATRTARKS